MWLGSRPAGVGAGVGGLAGPIDNRTFQEQGNFLLRGGGQGGAGCHDNGRLSLHFRPSAEGALVNGEGWEAEESCLVK